MADQVVHVRPPVWALLTAVVIGGLFYIGGKNVEADQRELSTITVSGQGKVNAVPDIAELSFGVRIERAPTSGAAMEQLAKQMTAVVDAVKKAGVEEKDIRTEQLSLNPSYDYTSGGQRLRGYDASQMLRVKVRDMQKTSDVLGGATAAGANQANDVQFTIDDPEALRAEAREEAILEAKEKAEMLADQLGVDLDGIQSYGEDSGGYYPPMVYGRGGAMAEDAAVANQATPLPSGSQEVVVNVSLTYKID